MNGRRSLLGAVILIAAVSSAQAGKEEQACIASVADMRARVAALPAGDLSRRFAENDLDTALSELAAGDADECSKLIERAFHTISTRPYRLYPGETLHGYGPDPQG